MSRRCRWRKCRPRSFEFVQDDKGTAANHANETRICFIWSIRAIRGWLTLVCSGADSSPNSLRSGFGMTHCSQKYIEGMALTSLRMNKGENVSRKFRRGNATSLANELRYAKVTAYQEDK